MHKYCCQQQRGEGCWEGPGFRGRLWIWLRHSPRCPDPPPPAQEKTLPHTGSRTGSGFRFQTACGSIYNKYVFETQHTTECILVSSSGQFKIDYLLVENMCGEWRSWKYNSVSTWNWSPLVCKKRFTLGFPLAPTGHHRAQTVTLGSKYFNKP